MEGIMPLTDQLAITRVRQIDLGKSLIIYDGTFAVSGWIFNISQLGGGRDESKSEKGDSLAGSRTMTITSDDLNAMDIQYLETVGIKDAKKITVTSGGNGNAIAYVLYYSG
jgi:hypothetical protein